MSPTRAILLACGCAYGAVPSGAIAHAADGRLLRAVVVTATAIPGASIEIDKIPGTVDIVRADALTREGTASLTTALNDRLSSISVNDNIADPFQPDILYRGFAASPVLGTSQGIAVYENGVRINEAFGDTVNWDLIPANAIQQVELVSSSPLYGLNALGGAISVTMKNGFSHSGTDLELSGGSYGQRTASVQFGRKSGIFGVYVAGRALDWNGWRMFSQDRMRDAYAALSVHTKRATLDVSYTRADNEMHGQSPAPVQELAVNRSLVFTGPQGTIDALNFLTVNGTAELAIHWSVQGVLYYRDFSQSVANGNTTNYVGCTNDVGVLCQPNGVTPLTDAQGQALPDLSNGGTQLIGENDYERIHAWGRGGSLQLIDAQGIARHANLVSVGVAVDDAATSYFSGAQIGVMNSQLVVLPSNLIVDTPENSAGALANGDATPVSVDSINENLSAFFTDTFNLTSRLAVTASGRYNLSHVDLADQRGSRLSGHNRYVHFNPAIGATYDVRRNVTLYGGWSVNNRTPTPSEIECSDPSAPCVLPSNLSGDPPDLKPVVAHAVELGLRGRVANSGRVGEITWHGSVFRTLLKNDIYAIATSMRQGFFQNIGDTRRQGVEAGIRYRAHAWSAYLDYSFVQATFLSPLVVPSPSNPYQDANGDIHVQPGDRLPEIPEHRVKLGVDFEPAPHWTAGATLNLVSHFYYGGDASNQLPPIPGYAVVSLHASDRPTEHLEIFAAIDNVFNRRYATFGTLSDPTGVGAPGVPANAVTNGPGVDNRFLTPGAPFEAFGGVRIRW
jgi:iron complex outermembrane receptor protein